MPNTCDQACQADWVFPVLDGFLTKGRLTEVGRGIVYGLRLAGVSQNRVASATHVTPATVRTVVKALDLRTAEAEANLPEFPECRQGTPEKTEPEEPTTVSKRRDEVLFVSESLAKRDRTTAAIRAAVKEATGEVWSTSTIRRDMVAVGLEFKVRDLTSALNEERMHNRVTKIPALRRAFNRKKMIFTDESMFKALDMRAQGQWCEGIEMPEPVRKDRWSASVHVWGAICEDFTTLVVLTGSVNQETYQLALGMMMQDLKKHGDPEDYILMQDGAPAHRAASTKEYLEKLKLETVEWPAYSPDLNPIENCWGIIKRRLEVNCFTKKDELEAEVIETFFAMKDSLVLSLVKSFPSRLDDCERLRGDDIKLTRYMP